MAWDPFPRGPEFALSEPVSEQPKTKLYLYLYKLKGWQRGRDSPVRRKTSVDACVSAGSVGDRKNQSDLTSRS
jgi:hypothetical protein